MKIRRHHHLIKPLLVLALMIAAFAGNPAAGANDAEVIIKITAAKFEYSTKDISIRKGVPVVLEFISTDRLHGFHCPGLEIRTDIEPQKVNRLRFTPTKTGTFPFHCDIFCGSGHEDMTGIITVTE